MKIIIKSQNVIEEKGFNEIKYDDPNIIEETCRVFRKLVIYGVLRNCSQEFSREVDENGHPVTVTIDFEG